MNSTVMKHELMNICLAIRHDGKGVEDMLNFTFIVADHHHPKPGSVKGERVALDVPIVNEHVDSGTLCRDQARKLSRKYAWKLDFYHVLIEHTC